VVDEVRVLRLLRTHGVVLEQLANLLDLDDFVAVVAAWVAPPHL
jgi:hypothetical protein